MMDNALLTLIAAEEDRQRSTLQLIPSENYASKTVREATGSWLMNKYSEGYPGKRYYQGLGVIDEIERLTIERACQVFNAEHANVQPYSGSIAVLATYFALAEPGDRMLGPLLDHGGHLSHGHRVNITAKLFDFRQYGVSQSDERFDFDEVFAIASDHKPKVLVVGGTAFPRQINFEKFREIADAVGAYLVADISHIAGLIAGDVHPAVFPLADVAVTTTHKTLRGPRGAIILCKAEHAKRVDQAVFPLIQGGPHQHTQAGVAAALFEALTPSFKTYATNVVENTRVLGEALQAKGLRLVSGGSDTHLLLADVTSVGLDGKTAATALETANIVVNANMLPFDKGSALRPSGVRLGAPSVTTRGMGAAQMQEIADLIMRVVEYPEKEIEPVRERVDELCRKFPVPDYYT